MPKIRAYGYITARDVHVHHVLTVDEDDLAPIVCADLKRSLKLVGDDRELKQALRRVIAFYSPIQRKTNQP